MNQGHETGALRQAAELIAQRMGELRNASAREASFAQHELAPEVARAAELLAEVEALRVEHGPALASLASTDWTVLQLRFGISEGLIRQLRPLCQQAYELLESTFTFLKLFPERASKVEDEYMRRTLVNELQKVVENPPAIRAYIRRLFAPRPERYGTQRSLIEDFISRLEAAGLPAPTKVYLRTEQPNMPTSYAAKDRAGDEGLIGQPR